MLNPAAVFVLSVSLAASAFGQDSVHFDAPRPLSPFAMASVPYSGERVSETVQTLADGTRITRKMPSTKMYRDSQGRTRTERQLSDLPARPGQVAPAPRILIEIFDPVARVGYVLDVQSKTAHRQELPEPPPGRGGARGGIAGRGAAPMVRNVPNPPLTIAGQTGPEQLGPQMIEGVLAEGIRLTHTDPVGKYGNDRPISTTTETWMSKELGLTILSKITDPRSGDYTSKLINISLAAPDPILFQPPPDYTVVEEKADFTITWGSPRQ